MATYAHALAATLQDLDVRLEYLTDTTVRSEGSARIRRWCAAVRSGPRRLAPDRREGVAAWSAPDLFREAQAHFDLHGRLLVLSCPNPPAIMHWTYPLPMAMQGARNIYTIHDAIPLERPDLTGISRSRHLRLLEQIRRSASLIITVSEHSRERLLKRLDLPSEMIVNTYQALSPHPMITDMTLPSGLEAGKYFLFFSSVEPRKNIARLIAAHRMSGATQPLAIVGPDGWRSRRVLPPETLADGRLVRLPWLERPALISLISHARAVLFPSLAEGFGLPLLEGMTLGAPVLTSNRDALAEVAGDGALLVDPEDVEAMARAIAALSSDEHLLVRLRTAGARRAAALSGHAYARRLASAYRLALQRPALGAP